MKFRLTIIRQLPTATDRDTFATLKESPPSAETHPHTFAWFTLVYMFEDSVRATWGGAQAAPAKPAQKPAAAKTEEPKKEAAPAKNDDDDMDLFGDDEPDEVSLLFNRQSVLIN